MIDYSKFTDGIPFSYLRKNTKKTKKKKRSPNRKNRKIRKTKKKPIKVPPRGVIIRKKNKLYRSDGKRLMLIE